MFGLYYNQVRQTTTVARFFLSTAVLTIRSLRLCRCQLESQDQLRRAREEMKTAEKAQSNLVTEVVWWQGLHMDVLVSHSHV